NLLEINPATGAVIGSPIVLPAIVFGAGDIGEAGMAIDPVNGNLWVGGGVSTVVAQITRTGTLVRSVDLSAQGIGGGDITGLAFDGAGALWVSTSVGAVYKVNLAFNLSQPTPAITSITALAKDGTAASGAAASANAGQTIEIVGTGFGATTEVLF